MPEGLGNACALHRAAFLHGLCIPCKLRYKGSHGARLMAGRCSMYWRM